jgi:hypothetical protein
MPAPAAISGTFSDLKTVKSRSVVQLVIEVPIEQGAAVIEAFGFPQPGAEIHVAVARLVAASTTIEHQPKDEKPRRKFSDMPRWQQSGIRCNEPAFWKWLIDRHNFGVDTPQEAAEAVREICGVFSRAELDSQPTAGERWDRMEAEFDIWMHHPELAV